MRFLFLFIIFMCFFRLVSVASDIVEPVLMFFSNSPEYVKSNGYLISGTISQFTPTIIYFYHLNDSNQDKKIYLRLRGNCEVFVDYYFSSSANNYFVVGKNVGANMIKNFNPKKIDLVGESIFEVDFKKSELVSGYFWFFTNGRIDFDSLVGEEKYKYILPLDNKHVKGIFGISRIVTYLPYDSDYLVVGDVPLDGIESNMPLKGTYKIFYQFIVNRNISSISFSARGGPSIPFFFLKTKTGDFYFTNGNIIKPYEEVEIFKKQVFLLELLTQPLGASYYPVYYRLQR